jgi:ketosteroid isomerase-like protein
MGSLRFELDELFDHGDVVVVVGKIQGVGKESGAEVSVPIGFVNRFRDGLVTRVEEYLDPLEAFRRA